MLSSYESSSNEPQLIWGLTIGALFIRKLWLIYGKNKRKIYGNDENDEYLLKELSELKN